MEDKAYAKINLSLDVFNRREDGYHDLKSIMIPIDFYDVLKIEKSEKDSYFSNISMLFDEKNTIVKAINYMRETYNIKDHFNVYLNKRIPAQAGLGGGSSDGASAIRILNQMYSLNMDDEKIIKACLSIGADVPFTYFNKAALVEGIGEKLEFIKIKKPMFVLLVKPKKGVSTKLAYESLDINKANHPNIDLIKKKIEKGGEYRDLLGNSLEEPALRLCKDILEVKNKLIDLNIDYPLMSGSGSTVFALSENKEKLIKAMDILGNSDCFVYLTKFLSN